jgi:hypothetical protein
LWTIMRIGRVGSWLRRVVSWRDVPPTELGLICWKNLTACWIPLRWLLGVPLLW